MPTLTSKTLNILVGTDPVAIADAMRAFRPQGPRPDLFGDGQAAERVVECLAASGVASQ